MAKVKIEDSLVDRAKRAAESAGYSSTDEFIADCVEKEIKRLEKKKQEAKTEEEKLSAERQLQKKKDELQQLKKDEEEKQNSAQRQALKRLTRDMEKAAENLQKYWTSGVERD